MSVPAIPAGYHSINVYLVVSDTEASIDFIQRAFGGELRERVADGSGRVVHAALRIGDSMLMLGQAASPAGVTKTTLYLYVEDCDVLFARAVAAGAMVVREMADQPYGDRNGGVADRDGNQWYVGTHKEHISDEEIARRYAERDANPAGQG